MGSICGEQGLTCFHVVRSVSLRVLVFPWCPGFSWVNLGMWSSRKNAGWSRQTAKLGSRCCALPSQFCSLALSFKLFFPMNDEPDKYLIYCAVKLSSE